MQNTVDLLAKEMSVVRRENRDGDIFTWYSIAITIAREWEGWGSTKNLQQECNLPSEISVMAAKKEAAKYLFNIGKGKKFLEIVERQIASKILEFQRLVPNGNSFDWINYDELEPGEFNSSKNILHLYWLQLYDLYCSQHIGQIKPSMKWFENYIQKKFFSTISAIAV